MIKSIKKTLKYFAIFAGIIIMVPSMLYLIIGIPEVQTLLARRITSHISESIKSTVSIGKIKYSFFNKMIINEFLIRDYNGDTLIYSGKVTAVLKKADFRHSSFILGHVFLEDPVVSIVRDSSGIMNLSWFLDEIRSPGSAEEGNNSTLAVNQIDISNARFSLKDKTGKKPKTGIDFSNIRISALNGIIDNLVTAGDSTTFEVYNLSFRESSGFNVKRFNSLVSLTGRDFTFGSVILNSDSSVVKIAEAGIHADSSASFNDFVHKVRLNILLDESYISTSELSYFIPSFRGIYQPVVLSGKVAGTISELRGRNIKLSFGSGSALNCDFDLSGLPELDNSFIYFGINSLRTNAKDIAGIRLADNKALKIPGIVKNLGVINFSGSFTGFTTDFVAYGKIRTPEGNISTDISFRPEGESKYKIKGLLTGNGISLGKITGNTSAFGDLSFTTNVDGYAYSLNRFSCNITGIIDSIEINRYKYRKIDLNGLVSEKAWDGNIRINEKNIKMDLMGMFNFSGELPEMDFTLNLSNANLYNLHFDKSDSLSSMSMLLTANFKGSNIDNLSGDIKLLNSNFSRNGKALELYDFSLKTFTENNKPAISLRTDFLDADLRGYYNFSGLASLVNFYLSRMMPSRMNAARLSKEAHANNFTYQINFKNTDRISNFFQTGIFLSDKSLIKGEVLADSIISIKGSAKTLNFRNNVFHDLNIDGIAGKDSLTISLASSSLMTFGDSEFKGFNSALKFSPDHFTFGIDWDNKDKTLNRGRISARGTFSGNEAGKGRPVLHVYLDSTGVYNRNKLWNISRSVITLDSNALNINRLYISNMERFYLIKGTISGNPQDTLAMEFRGIDISPLNYLINRKSQSGDFPLSIKGEMNGRILLTDVYKNFLFESDLRINNFSVLQSDYGDLSILSKWNTDRKVADISAGNNLKGMKMLDIEGYYDPQSKVIDLTGIADKLPVDALNPLLKAFASGITGTATGKVKLSGVSDKLVMNGALLVEDGTLKVDYLQTKYKLNDSIRFNKDGIIFRNVRITDEKGNAATLNGLVSHKYFKEFSPDIVINTTDCMVLNTKPKDNEMFYGSAYATGVTTIKGGPSVVSFDISARTGRNTKFSIPLTTSETVSQYSFISFINNDSTSGEENTAKVVMPVNSSSTGLDLNFDLNITPDAEMKLIFDEKVGDEITGTGSGALNIRYDPKGNFRIYGDYVIEDGTYLFTLKNILNKKFKVENGGKVSFNGDIDNAEIDMKAIYTANADLYSILQDEKYYNEKTDVECQINLTGNLFNPVVKLDIYLPKADESTRTLVKNEITTEEELSRQFLYLLVMNSFYSENPYSSNLAAATTQTGTSAMAVTTTEMISNQLSNWLSQISKDFDLGLNYRPGGYTDINSNELELAFKTQLLNDKVTINGNFDVRGAGTNNTDNLTGDFDVEYRLTEKIRFKVFNRFNNPYTGKQSDYTQGIGLFYTQDFDRFSDLFKRKEKPAMKKEKEVTAPEKQ